MNWLEALILGIIQGLTEFLPVSSSGHLELGKVLLGLHPADPIMFSIVVHAATALSTILIFRKDIWQIIQDLLKFKWNMGTKYTFLIILSMIPVGITGLFIEKKIELFFDGQIILVGSMLILTGILLYITTKASEKTGAITPVNAVIIGIAQAIAVLPGISRSGATISTSLLLGINKEQAARFSFLMVLPPIIGATLLKIKDYLEIAETKTITTGETISSTSLFIGFIAAFITGMVACKLMIKIVKRSKLQYFAYYCIAIGIISITWYAVK